MRKKNTRISTLIETAYTIMAKQVPWNKIILEEFISLAVLTDEEEKIIRTRVKGGDYHETGYDVWHEPGCGESSYQ